MTEKIQDALKQLDPLNDNHWTSDGMPRLDTVKMFAQDPSLTRDAVTAALPGFSRATAAAPAETKPGEPPVPHEPSAAQTDTTSESVVNADDQPPQDDTLPETKPGEPPVPHEPTLDELRVRLEAELAEANEDLEYSKAVVSKIQKKLDEVLDGLQKRDASQPHAIVVQGYLAAQQAIRDHRAKRNEQIKGVNLKELLPQRAPLDQQFLSRGIKKKSR